MFVRVDSTLTKEHGWNYVSDDRYKYVKKFIDINISKNKYVNK